MGILEQCGGERVEHMAALSSTKLPSPKEYRAFADECLRWANRAPDQDRKNTLVEIARVWMQIARDRECQSQGPSVGEPLGRQRVIQLDQSVKL